jgi:F5/8 type C domain
MQSGNTSFPGKNGQHREISENQTRKFFHPKSIRRSKMTNRSAVPRSTWFRNLSIIFAVSSLLFAACNQAPTTEKAAGAEKTPAAPKTIGAQSLTTLNNAIFARNFYDYGASVIQEGDTRKYWWCAQDGTTYDVILYRTYTISTGQYSPVQQVLIPNNSVPTWDRSYICDPSVIQGQFVNPDNNQTYAYAMYYTATDRGPGTPFNGTNQDGTNNRIGIAYSNDGINWARYSQNPIIFPQTSPTNTYGAGQAATYNSDGAAGIRVLYTDFSSGGEKLYTRTSSDGRTFGPATVVSNSGVIPNNSGPLFGQTPSIGNGDLAFDSVGQYWYATFALAFPPGEFGSNTPNASSLGFRLGDRERYQFGLYRMAQGQFPTGTWEVLGYVDSNLTGNTINHNAALVRDKWGNVNATLPTIETIFSGGANDNTTWDLYSATWNSASKTVPLKRYFSASASSYWTTTGYVGSGYALQQTLGELERGKVAGTVPLYGCQVGPTDRFLSTLSNCENQYPLGVNGFIYSSPPVARPSAAIYRCYNGSSHFASTHSNCEGATTEFLLGYVLTASTSTSLLNTGFESPSIPGLQYRPSGADWTFTDVAGIQRNGSAFGAASAPEGLQTAFLQGSNNGLGAMTQAINIAAGTYSLKFKAAQRPGQVQSIKLSLDGVQVGSNITPTGTAFTDYSSATFTVSAGNRILRLEATNANGDNTCFLDGFSLQASGGNLASGKTVTSNNSLELSEWGVSKLTDGITTSDPGSRGFTSNAYFSNNISGNPVYIEVDLGSNQSVSSIKLYPRNNWSAVGGGSPNFPVDFSVQVAPDGSSTYTTVKTVGGQINPDQSAQTYSFAATSARRIRVAVTGLGSPASDEASVRRLQLSEMQVY